MKTFMSVLFILSFQTSAKTVCTFKDADIDQCYPRTIMVEIDFQKKTFSHNLEFNINRFCGWPPYASPVTGTIVKVFGDQYSLIAKEGKFFGDMYGSEGHAELIYNDGETIKLDCEKFKKKRDPKGPSFT